MAVKDVNTMKIAPKVWKNGELIDWDDAQIHVMSHVVNYGSSVFEGIRCYETSKGSAVFCLTEHMHRLVNSGKDFKMGFKIFPPDFLHSPVEIVRPSGPRSSFSPPPSFPAPSQ